MTELNLIKDYKLLPWQMDQWQRLYDAKQRGRLPHALLLTGGAGLGKSHFAHLLAASLLCTDVQDNGMPCGACKACRLVQADTHPDFTLITPEEPGKGIKIDVIRAFTQRGSLTSQSGGYKAIIIEPADALNTAAANSLLKTLEEPVDRTVMILVTANAGRLPATIRSRCQQYHFMPPDTAIATEWLNNRLEGAADTALLLSLASGAPLLSLEYAHDGVLAERAQMIQELTAIFKKTDDPIGIAQRWSNLDQKSVVKWFSGWVIDLIRVKIASESAAIINIDQRERLQALSRKVNSKRLYALMDRLFEANRTLGAQLNTQMQLESLLLDWADIGVE
ncbi:DNA polymerase III subunit delta' [Sedimenticola selenatireducens]|jgi:DNA polymerase-3 subunit delta'|uniref:DNA polymerase III subunit delta' n=1 Tax=Sedimenticola selenatireducens TaxID=191960 RepID=A0A557RZB5_9GAMM|nr:DNA polymerase III subunit delta' [Sedimenticola selenatireducens]TVO70478.1 DNA polymerase III subunit delta' [Sedimenticola selenatireducens]TVT63055.1 MAG: DNA polymerase III subunit delta' [Sedimenticola selenatireducens]